MNNVTIFWLQLFVSLLVYSVAMAWYGWPYLTKLNRNAALVPLLWVHVPRYIGMTLLVTFMFDQRIPKEYVFGAAYGDLVEAALAFVSIYALRRAWGFAISLVWLTNTWGLADLLNGLRSIIGSNVPSYNLGTIWYIYTFYAPLVIISHALIFWILLSRSWKK